MSKHLKGQDAVVVFSGGQDSTTCLGWAIEKFNRVVALSFNYGQKHSIELQQASKIAKDLGVEHYVMDVSLLNQLAPNALTRTDIEVVNGKDVKDGEEPNTVVRGRNGLFLWLASIYASTHGIENVVTGVCETDFSGYIDCRDVFIKSLNVAIGLGMDDKITIHTPLMFLNKVETWELAQECNVLDTVIKDSHTCYNGDRTSLLGCGECPACHLRNRSLYAFAQLNNVDLEQHGVNILELQTLVNKYDK